LEEARSQLATVQTENEVLKQAASDSFELSKAAVSDFCITSLDGGFDDVWLLLGSLSLSFSSSCCNFSISFCWVSTILTSSSRLDWSTISIFSANNSDFSLI
jgi:hypothetical protein